MPTVIIDGQEFDLPDEVTGHELRGLADIPPEKTVYTMEDGKHRVIGPDERVRLARGARVGTLQPFTTGGRRDVSEPVETRRLFVDGRELYVPANLTAFELHEMAEIPPERSLYVVNRGKHRIVDEHERLDVEDGARMGTVQPFTTGGSPEGERN